MTKKQKERQDIALRFEYAIAISEAMRDTLDGIYSAENLIDYYYSHLAIDKLTNYKLLKAASRLKKQIFTQCAAWTTTVGNLRRGIIMSNKKNPAKETEGNNDNS